MRIGKMDRLVVLSKPSQTTADSQVTYDAQATVWASFEGRGGADRSGIVAESASVFGIRYRSDVTPRWCVEMGTRRFQIESIAELGRNVGLELVCTELQPGGQNA